MANFVFNPALGRAAELYNRVKVGDPSASRLVVVAIVANGQTDAVMRDYNTLADLLGDSLVAEATNAGYARLVLAAADLAALAHDDANDRVDLDTGDLAMGTISAGDNWTDVVFGYDPNGAGGTDAEIIPISCHDYPLTADGSAVTVLTPNGFYRAAAA